ncbi:hypothetical protein U9M48_029904 [Paspalum notatum var. saurae]|uniref:Uncharacterized protein n=1 Tax=Paspalum notatum var. saurae TaxID=547442 RepID=A0AAQ3TYY5_PASNO
MSPAVARRTSHESMRRCRACRLSTASTRSATWCLGRPERRHRCIPPPPVVTTWRFTQPGTVRYRLHGYPKSPSSMTGAGMVLVNTFEETFGDIYGEGVWRKFSKGASNINRNVVALASFNGFFIEWNGSTIILTSASLVRNSGDENKIVENLRIEVLMNNQCRKGMLQHYSLHYNVALVSVKDYRAIRPSNTLLYRNVPSRVAAVGRCFKSGALMATSGDLVSWTGTLDCDFLAQSTCKTAKAGIGGPLVTLDGDVVGMNFYDTRIGTPFLLWEDICKILEWFETKRKLSEVGNDGGPSGVPVWKMDGDDKTKLNRWPVPMPRWCHPDDVDVDKSNDDELGFETRSGRKRRYVKRHMNWATEGVHYNVALVSVKDYPARRPSNTRFCWNIVPFKVAVVGRCFNSGALNGYGGNVFSWKGTRVKSLSHD